MLIAITQDISRDFQHLNIEICLDANLIIILHTTNPSMYYVIISGCNKDHPQPLIVRESGKDAVSYLIETYQVIRNDFYNIECDLENADIWSEFSILKTVALEHYLYDKFRFWNSKQCKSGNLNATIIRAGKTWKSVTLCHQLLSINSGTYRWETGKLFRFQKCSPSARQNSEYEQ